MSSNYTNLTEHADDFSNFAIATQKIWQIGGGVILAFGVPGNFLILYILSKTGLRGSPPLIHMMVLTISDIVMLSTGVTRNWISQTFQIDVRNLCDVCCKIHSFLTYLSMDFSAWVLALFSLERFEFVHHPLRHLGKSHTKTTFGRLLLVFLMLCGVNCHFLWTYGFKNGTESCAVVDNKTSYYDAKIFVWIDLMFVSVFPFVLMLLFSILIVRSLGNSKMFYNATISVITMTPGGGDYKKMNRNTEQTRLMVWLAVIYACLTIPHALTYIVESVMWDDLAADGGPGIRILNLVWTITYIMMACNQAMNIILFTMRDRTIKRQFLRLFSRKNRNENEDSSTGSLSTSLSSRYNSRHNSRHSKYDSRFSNKFRKKLSNPIPRCSLNEDKLQMNQDRHSANHINDLSSLTRSVRDDTQPRTSPDNKGQVEPKLSSSVQFKIGVDSFDITNRLSESPFREAGSPRSILKSSFNETFVNNNKDGLFVNGDVVVHNNNPDVEFNQEHNNNLIHEDEELDKDAVFAVCHTRFASCENARCVSSRDVGFTLIHSCPDLTEFITYF